MRMRWALMVLLLVCLAIGGGGWWYLNAADRPPLHVTLPSRDSIPLLRPADDPLAELSTGERDLLTGAAADAEAQIIGADEGASVVLGHLRAAGFSVSAAALETTADGKRALVLAAPYASGSLGLGGGGLASGIRDVARLGETKDVDISSIDEVVLFLRDDQDRTLFGIGVPAQGLRDYRAGTITRAQLIRSAAIRGDSRAAVLDAMRQELP